MDPRTKKPYSPSRTYVYGVLKRNESKLTKRKPTVLESVRANSCYKEQLEPYLHNLRDYIRKLNPDPSLVINIDETPLTPELPNSSILTTPDSEVEAVKVIEERHKNITLTLAVALSGDSYISQIIHPSSKVPPEFLTFLQHDYFLSATPSGYQTTKTFHDYLVRGLLPQLLQKRKQTHPQQQAIVLLVDGHVSRRNPQLLTDLHAHNVVLILLPPHSSHLLQPCDCGINSIVKRKLRDYLPSPEARFVYSFIRATLIQSFQPC